MNEPVKFDTFPCYDFPFLTKITSSKLRIFKNLLL